MRYQFIVTVDTDKLDSEFVMPTKVMVGNYIRNAIRAWGHGSDPESLDWDIADSKPTVKKLRA